MTQHASGTFEVKMTPQTSDDKGAAVSRYLLDKKFHGDIEGTSKGEMLAVSTTVDGSAGYVAMEQVTATLGGRKGTFALQHSGTMTRGAPQLSITVVPDSGTDQLVGLSGKMEIKITDGKHFYSFRLQSRSDALNTTQEERVHDDDTQVGASVRNLCNLDDWLQCCQ